MDKETKEFLEDIKSNFKGMQEAQNRILAYFGEKGEFKAAQEAITQLEADMKAIATDVKAQIEMARKQAYDINGGYRGMYATESDAKAFGLHILGVVSNNKKAMEAYQRDFKDSYQRAQSTIDESLGGALIDPVFSTRIIRLVEEYGVIPAKAFRMPMPGPMMNYKKQTGEASVYLVGEGAAPTETSLTWAVISLIARKWGALVYYPTELGEDAAVAVAELIGRSFAWAMAYNLDRVGFNGTGSVADMRVNGIIPKLRGLHGTIGNIAGIQVGTGNAWSELTLADHLATAGKLPQYAAPRAEWYCHRSYFFNTMTKIMLSQGGATAGEVQGRRMLMFNGDPVNLVQVMPRVEANSQVAALYGDLSQVADLGIRKEMTIMRSTDYKFAEGLITVLGITRQDLFVHSVGNADATEANRVAGPITALYTAAG